MNRLPILLIAGIALLPSGCLVMPLDVPPYRGAGSETKLADAASMTELPPTQAAQVCLTTAESLEKLGHEKEAILEYQLAREHNPQLPGVARRLAVLYSKQGDTEHARAEFQIALQQQPHDADLLNDLGNFHYQLGQNVEAEKYLRQAVAIDPKHKRAWVNLGKVLSQLGRYEESCEAFAKVVRPAQAAANVGILLAKEGKIPEARQVLHKALTLEPDLQAAQVVLTQIEAATPPDVRLTME
jgi:Tfp pilus assembly protein PilF